MIRNWNKVCCFIPSSNCSWGYTTILFNSSSGCCKTSFIVSSNFMVQICTLHAIVTVLLEKLKRVVYYVVNLFVININLQHGFAKLPLAICDEFSSRTWRCHYTQKSLLTYLGRRDLILFSRSFWCLSFWFFF